jgi:hypothetical protein
MWLVAMSEKSSLMLPRTREQRNARVANYFVTLRRIRPIMPQRGRLCTDSYRSAVSVTAEPGRSPRRAAAFPLATAMATRSLLSR